MSNFTYLVIGASIASSLTTGGYALVPREFYDPACDIKGNISYNSGQKIYQTPGQHYSDDTRIPYPRANVGSVVRRTLGLQAGGGPDIELPG